jgi:tetratricopeptide (TPR) repeat protein
MNTSQTKTSPVLLLVLILVGILLIVSVLIYFQVRGSSEAKLDISRQQELASNLLDAKLYIQAVTEYQRLLNLSGLDKKKQANINYIVGNIYLNEMNDYENAAARFVTAKFLDPEGELKDKINKNLVICYERMGRSLEAQKELDRSTNLEQTGTVKKGGAVVARIGEREITMMELEDEIEKLPPSVQTQFKEKTGKIKFLQNYISSELLYHTAIRKGLDQDKDVKEGMLQMQRQIMINKLLSQEIPQDFQVSENDINLYYQAHKEEFKDKKPDEVKSQIESELKKMKQQEAYGNLVSRMMEAEKVRIFDDQL